VEAVVVVAVIPSPKTQRYDVYGGVPPEGAAVKVVTNPTSVVVGLTVRTTARAEPTISETEPVAVAARESVAVTVTMNVPAAA